MFSASLYNATRFSFCVCASLSQKLMYIYLIICHFLELPYFKKLPVASFMCEKFGICSSCIVFQNSGVAEGCFLDRVFPLSPDCSTVAWSLFTAACTSKVQVILLSQPPK